MIDWWWVPITAIATVAIGFLVGAMWIASSVFRNW